MYYLHNLVLAFANEYLCFSISFEPLALGKVSVAKLANSLHLVQWSSAEEMVSSNLLCSKWISSHLVPINNRQVSSHVPMACLASPIMMVHT